MVAAIVDLPIIAFFVAAPMIRERPAFLWIDCSIAAVLMVEIVARMLACGHVLRIPDHD